MKDRLINQVTSAPLPPWRCGITAGILAGVLALTTGAAHAQDGALGAADTTRIDGRDFGGVDLPAPPQQEQVTLSADRAWVWKDRQTNRVLLDRDVHVRVGSHVFEARRAVVWLEPILIGGEEGDQIAVYFDEVKTSYRPRADSPKAESNRLLVTGVVVGEKARLRVDLIEKGRPEDGFVKNSEERLARYLLEVMTRDRKREESGEAAVPDPDGDAAQGPEAARTQEPAPGGAEPPDPMGGIVAQSDDTPTEPGIGEVPRVGKGLVFFAGGQSDLVERGGEQGGYTVALREGVAIQFQPSDGQDGVQLTARRGVVFIGAAEAGLLQTSAEDVQGIYLEGDVVVTNGAYTLRGNRVYYDVQTDRAVVLDAVFWTFDEKRGMPLYMRADAIRQESLNQWSSDDVVLSNVGFAEPHFSIGASEVTLTRLEPGPGVVGGSRTEIDARHAGFRVGKTTVLGSPRVKGEFKPTALEGVEFETVEGDPIIRTEWNLLTLLGLEQKPGNEAMLLLDGYLDRGLGVGAEANWEQEDSEGGLLSYFIHDNGTDIMSSGARIDRFGENRGLFQADHVWRINDEWSLFLEGNYISDPAFTDAFFQPLAETYREFITSAYLRRKDDAGMIDANVRGTFNDFIANEYLLQSLGYHTQKYPELGHYLVGQSLLSDVVSYNSETTAAVMSLAFSENELREQGFDTPKRAAAIFGLTPTDSIGEFWRDQGLNEDAVFRLDTRHEVEVPLKSGPVNIVPFAAGRLTIWSDDFAEFRGEEDPENYRVWGGAGVRASTSFVRVNNNAESSLLDVHRLRHIVEPNVTAWYGDSNVDLNELPVYDSDVEPLLEGAMVRAGVRNTWQTMRGGEGRRRSSDWIVLNTDFVWSSDDTESRSPYGRWVEARPELTNAGTFLRNDLRWYLSDSLSLTSDLIWDFDADRVTSNATGIIVDHGSGFSVFTEYREIAEPDMRLIALGTRYELTRKYAMEGSYRWDVDEKTTRWFGVEVNRRFPQWTVNVALNVDDISDRVSFGISVRPVGVGGEDRRRVYTRGLGAGERYRRGAYSRQRVSYGPFAAQE